MEFWRTRLWPAHAVLALLVAFPLAAASAESTFTYLDLQPKANHRLTADLHAVEGNHLANLPQGELKCEGSQFKVGEQMVHLRNQKLPDLPDRVDIKVDAAFDRLHVLHSTGYGESPQMEEGTEIGAYTLHYADDTTERIPIIYGEDIRDWWDWPERTALKRARVAWTGSNPRADKFDRKIRLFSVVWPNPHPEKKVTIIEISSSNTMCDPFVVALTTEKK